MKTDPVPGHGETVTDIQRHYERVEDGWTIEVDIDDDGVSVFLTPSETRGRSVHEDRDLGGYYLGEWHWHEDGSRWKFTIDVDDDGNLAQYPDPDASWLLNDLVNEGVISEDTASAIDDDAFDSRDQWFQTTCLKDRCSRPRDVGYWYKADLDHEDDGE